MKTQRKPEWLRQHTNCHTQFGEMASILMSHGLHTICQSGRCPNRNECWSLGTAAFMIGGEYCTRACKFCNTQTAKKSLLNAKEPELLAQTIRRMQLAYAVITSVSRDDLPDAGLSHWMLCVQRVKEVNPDIQIETLIPDFNGNMEAVSALAALPIAMMAYNVETTRRITPLVRNIATYERSLTVLQTISDSGKACKSGFMLGLGENENEVSELIHDLYSVGCRYLSIGQYLQPSRSHYPVVRYYEPTFFEQIKQEALSLGFVYVESGPFVRSSYHASLAIEYMRCNVK